MAPSLICFSAYLGYCFLLICSNISEGTSRIHSSKLSLFGKSTFLLYFMQIRQGRRGSQRKDLFVAAVHAQDMSMHQYQDGSITTLQYRSWIRVNFLFPRIAVHFTSAFVQPTAKDKSTGIQAASHCPHLISCEQ